MKRLWLGALGTVFALVVGADAASAGYVLVAGEGGDVGKALSPLLDTSAAYRALAENPASSSIRLVEAYPEELQLDTTTLAVSLGEGLDLRVRRVRSYTKENGSLVWSGVVLSPGAQDGRSTENDFDPMDTLILTKSGNKLMGNLKYRGDWFQIRPVGPGLHVAVKVDQSRLPPDHSPGHDDRLPRAAMPVAGSAEDKVNTVITAIVHYTAAAAAAANDINQLIDTAEGETNTSYINSGIAITLQVVKTAQVTYNETGVSLTDLTRYRVTNDGFMDYVHTQRNQHGADVAILLLDNLDACGRAYLGASASTAYGVVAVSCATGYYSFGHEIGHLQFAQHNPETDSNPYYSYGHGYRYNGASPWRTIMAYAPPDPRVQYWSNPNKTYNGVPMGTASTHDNARVLNNTRGTIAGFKTAPSCIPDGGFDDTLGQTSCCSGFAVSGSTYCTNPADWYNGWASCTHICGTPLAGGCVPSGGIDDTLSRTRCCSGAAVPGSTFCNDPADYGTDWTTCAQICQ